ncbi:MAG: PVC-type heme-binding CxxCH protein [Candidatus Hydrogenedentes bacterium]|nr:PVC-type heme-binding CxxCH protein [Candidatus Hydrogenedentota bacterium]
MRLTFTAPRRVLLALLLFHLVPVAFSQDAGEQDSIDRDYSSELPRIAPTEPADVQNTFEVKPGFRMELIAAEPLVLDPVAIAYDEDGRAYVVDMCGYSEERDENLSVIGLLEDTDGDGKFDKRSDFLPGLQWPTAVACYDGGVFIGMPPDIIYAKDTDGDGIADVKETVYTGFNWNNVQGMMNTFLWGPDGRIHASASSTGAEARLANDPNAPVMSLRGRDFAWEPKTRALFAESGGAQHGMSYDDFGRKYVCHNSSHIELVLYEDRYTARNPYLSAPNSREIIAVDGAAADVFRISPVEPWRIVRTRLRVKGITPGIIEGGGTAAGYFTSATGVTIYRGDAWPEEYRNNAFIGDVGSNLVHRKILDPAGVTLKAHRAEGEGKTEFVRSKDIWFRPVQFSNSPDGNLVVIDMYREYIEHPASLPPVIKKHMDLTSGRDRGRLYRIVPEDFKQPEIPQLSKASTAELVTLLDHRNSWHSETAARLIYERQDKSIVPALGAMIVASTSELGRKNALYALQTLDSLTPETLVKGMNDSSPLVRANAARIAETQIDNQEVLAKMASLSGDEDIRVRYQVTYSLGETQDPVAYAALTRIAESDGADPWFQFAIKTASFAGSAEIYAALVGNETFRAKPENSALLVSLAEQVGARGIAEELTRTLVGIDALPEPKASLAQSQVRALMQGLTIGGKSAEAKEILAQSPKAEALLAQSLEQARAVAPDAKAEAGARVDAIKTLGFDSFENGKTILPPLLNVAQPVEVQLAALTGLRKYDDPAIATILLEGWGDFSPQVRAQSIEALFSRKAWTLALLDAIEQGAFKAGQLDSTRIRALQTNQDAEIKSRAESLLAQFNYGTRQPVVDSYQEVLAMQGDIARGKASFVENCSKCHMLQGVGFSVGPDLSAVANFGPDKILINVLDPNREVNPQFMNYTIDTDDLETHSGVITSESATSITLKRASGETDTILRVNIEDIRSDNISIMPEGWEEAIDKQAMADLIAYLMSIK